MFNELKGKNEAAPISVSAKKRKGLNIVNMVLWCEAVNFSRIFAFHGGLGT
jgi:hypothetical protein